MFSEIVIEALWDRLVFKGERPFVEINSLPQLMTFVFKHSCWYKKVSNLSRLAKNSVECLSSPSNTEVVKARGPSGS